jgi:hypothetical protein
MRQHRPIRVSRALLAIAILIGFLVTTAQWALAFAALGAWHYLAGTQALRG